MGFFGAPRNDLASLEARKERILQDREKLKLDTERKLTELTAGLNDATRKKDAKRIKQITDERARVVLAKTNREKQLNQAWAEYERDLRSVRKSA